MVRQVDFYLISNRVADAKFKLASRLCHKVQRLRQRLLVVTEDANATATLDRVLWTFSDTSFAAHDSFSDDCSASSIHIGESGAVDEQVLQHNYDVLINLTHDIPLYSDHFNRVLEIVEPVDSEKATARERYKNYKNQGCKLDTHNIEL